MDDKILIECFHYQIDCKIRRAVKNGGRPMYLLIRMDDGACYAVEITEELVAALTLVEQR